MMNLLVFGSRSINDKQFIEDVLKKIIGNKKDVIIFEGDAIGVDKIAGIVGKSLDIEVRLYIPEWNKYGKKAGILRSEDMVKECNKAVGFWDNTSKGTKYTIDLLVKYKKPFLLFIKEKESWRKINHE